MKLGNKFRCYVPPLIKKTTIFFKSTQDFFKQQAKHQTYGINQSELKTELSNIIKTIEHGKYCELAPSGLAAIYISYIALIKKKDAILIPRHIYEPNQQTLQVIKKTLKCKIYYYSHNTSLKTIQQNCIKYNIKIIVIETPGSITLDKTNITALAKLANKLHIKTIADNTHSCGINEKPLTRGIDISIQALTKFYCGANDIFMGSITTNKKNIITKIKNIISYMGISIQNEEYYTILRNIHNVIPNYKRSEKKAHKIAQFLHNNPQIKKLFYPHTHNKKGGTLISFIINTNNTPTIYKFINSLKLFKLGYSWGGAKSIIMFYKNIKHTRPYLKIKSTAIIIRIYIGAENSKDLIHDLKQALKKIK
ncbi:PLP-dependent transferase [Candidatus Vidania fulgoroideae]|uniref:PLP-dependent transferase n=1 Tax=Candidatus Vidania fulgoroideorum TaxID=881286 RepID=A0A974X785_9PROT|nr:PLP-dependent transferase [Candidatus Vidania fulgoroideae]